MPARILTLPTRTAPPPAPEPVVAFRRGGWARRYRFMDLVQALALETYSQRSQIEQLRKLAKLSGLPAPINKRVWAGKVFHGADAICIRSEWDAAQIDAWLHQPDGPTLPPIPTAQALPPVIDLRAEMRRRAANN